MKKSYLRLVRRTFRSLRHPRLRHLRWWKLLTRPLADRALWIPCRDTVASGLAIGLFFSMMVVMPFQMVAVALITMRAKANVPLALAACWVSNPVTTGPLVWGQFVLGQWMRDVLGVPMPHFIVQAAFKVPGVGVVNAASFFLGMITSGVVLALLAYPLVHLFSAVMPQHLPVRRHRRCAPAAEIKES